jgi:hypothetical protein
MIIQDKSQQPSTWEVYSRYAAVSTILLVMLYLVVRFFFPYFGANVENVIFCGAEFTRGDSFISQGYSFKNAQTQSDEKAYKGNYSSKTDKNNPSGMMYVLRLPTAGDRYRVSVRRYRTSAVDGELVIESEGKNGFEKREDVASSKDSDGWELLEMTFNVPEKGGKTINIYVFSNGNSPVFFDNLTIEKIAGSKNELNIEPFTPQTFHLEIAEQFMQKLNEKRLEALNNGILINKSTDWLNAKIDDGSQKLDAEVRLKGNRLDNLQSDKWSYNIKVKSPYSWQRMQSFSIHNPASKQFVSEWIYHQFLQKEKVMATRYDFFQLKLNNRQKGIYAFEENPDIALAIYNNRQPGPIVRFSDDAYWNNVGKNIEQGNPNTTNYQVVNALDAADAEPLKNTQTATNEEMANHFKVAQNLMHQYQYNLKPASNIFDLDLMARYFAIMDVMQAYQSLDWRDQCFYFNPVSSKLEPVGISGFGLEIKPYRKRPFIGHGLYNPEVQEIDIYMNLFLDDKFIAKYCQYLHQYSQKSFIENFLLDIEKEALRRQQFIRKEFSDYVFDADLVLNNAKNIRTNLTPTNNISLKAKINGRQGGGISIKISNFHGLPLQIVGFGVTENAIRDTVQGISFIPTNLSGVPPKYTTLTAKGDVTYIFYKLPGVNEVFYSQLSFWNAPEANVPEQQLFSRTSLETNALYTVQGNSVIFKAGSFQINKDIIIPVGYKVSIPAGTVLNFAKGAKFLSKSPVETFGQEDNPVEMRGASGILITDVIEESVFRNTLFDKISNLDYNNWWLPGGVTIYNSKVSFSNCTFSYSKAPESLSIMQSSFELSYCNFSRNEQKGLVTHYSQGKITGGSYTQNGLVAIELLKTRAEIDKCFIEQTKQNGLSVGEESKVMVKYIEIKDTDIGVVSTDLSKITIANIKLQNCQRGFAAYKKQPEFGGSQIIVDNYSANGVKVLHKIELGSSLKLKGKELKGY